MAKRLVEVKQRSPRVIQPGSGSRKVLGLRLPVLAVAAVGLLIAGGLFAYSRRGTPEVIGEFGGQAGIANAPSTTADPAGVATAIDVDAPDTVTAVSGDGLGSIRVDWTAPGSGAPLDGYRVVFTGASGVPTEVAVPPETLGLTQYGLTPGTYTVSVKAVSAAVVGSPTTVSSVVATGLPGIPLNVSARVDAATGSLLVGWEPPLDDGGKPVDWYTITYQPVGGKTVKPVTTSVKGDERSREEFGLAAGDYQVSVVALTQVGSGRASAPIDVTVTPPPPGVTRPGDPAAGAPSTLPPPLEPRSVVATSGPGGLSIKVTWMPPESGVPKDGYRVYFLRNGESTPLTVPLEADRTTLTQYGFTEGVYKVSIAAITDAKVGRVATVRDPVTLTGPKPGDPVPGQPPVVKAPEAVQAVSGDAVGSIRVDWKVPASGAPLDGYRVTFKPVSGGAPVVVPMGPDALGLTQFDLSSGDYEVSVVAVSESVVGPPGTAAGRVTATSLPGAPEALNVSPGSESGSLKMTWRPPTSGGGRDIDWYTITYTPVGNDGRKVISTSVKGDKNELAEFGLPLGAYQITIVALSQVGTGPAAPAVSVTVS